jgi:hypothetical protein
VSELNGTPRRLPLGRLPGPRAGGPVPSGLGQPRPETVLPSEFATSRPGAHTGGPGQYGESRLQIRRDPPGRRPRGRRCCSRWAGGPVSDATTGATAVLPSEFATTRPGARAGGRTVITPTNSALPTAGPRAAVAAAGGPAGPDPTQCPQPRRRPGSQSGRRRVTLKLRGACQAVTGPGVLRALLPEIASRLKDLKMMYNTFFCNNKDGSGFGIARAGPAERLFPKWPHILSFS